MTKLTNTWKYQIGKQIKLSLDSVSWNVELMLRSSYYEQKMSSYCFEPD